MQIQYLAVLVLVALSGTSFAAPLAVSPCICYRKSEAERSDADAQTGSATIASRQIVDRSLAPRHATRDAAAPRQLLRSLARRAGHVEKTEGAHAGSGGGRWEHYVHKNEHGGIVKTEHKEFKTLGGHDRHVKTTTHDFATGRTSLLQKEHDAQGRHTATIENQTGSHSFRETHHDPATGAVTKTVQREHNADNLALKNRVTTKYRPNHSAESEHTENFSEHSTPYDAKLDNETKHHFNSAGQRVASEVHAYDSDGLTGPEHTSSQVWRYGHPTEPYKAFGPGQKHQASALANQHAASHP